MTQLQIPTLEPAALIQRPTAEEILSLLAQRYEVSEDLAGKWMRDLFERLP